MPLPARPPSIDRRSARHSVYEHLREWIVYGPLDPGESIRDTEVAASLGVSRTPVREALLRLSEEGLVQILPGSGTRVAALDLERAGQLFAIGAVLDALAAQTAAGRIGPRELDQLATLVDRMRPDEDPVTLQAIDEEFHRIYYEAAENPPLAEMLEEITVNLRRYDRAGFHHAESIHTVQEEHQALLDALRSGDASDAADAARQNWQQAWRRLQGIFAAPATREPADTRTPTG